ncbi:MAG: DUF6457 domain-containing protein [Pseudonocardiaceae bacterium]
MNTLEEWVGEVCRELGILNLTEPGQRVAMQTRVLDMARDVAHDVARPAAPLTAYLLGLAAGRTSDPEATADELAERVRLLAQRWAAEQDT